jgi:hypothetical protein
MQEIKNMIEDRWLWVRESDEARDGVDEYNQAVTVMVQASVALISEEALTRIANLYRDRLPEAQREEQRLEAKLFKMHGGSGPAAPLARDLALDWAIETYEKESGKRIAPDQIPPGFDMSGDPIDDEDDD